MRAIGAFRVLQNRAQQQSGGGACRLTVRGTLLLTFFAIAFAVFRFAPKIARSSGSREPLVMKRVKSGGNLILDGPRKAIKALEDDFVLEEDEEDEYTDDDGGNGYDGEDEEAKSPVVVPTTEATKEQGDGKSLRGAADGKGETPAPSGGGKTAVNATQADATKPAEEAKPKRKIVPPVVAVRPLKNVVTVPNREGMVPEERPLEGDLNKQERGVTSQVMEEDPVHSMNPPYYLNPDKAAPADASQMPLASEWPYALGNVPATVTFGNLDDERVQDVLGELNRRLIIGITMGVHSGHTNVPSNGLNSLPVFNTLMRTFLPTAQPHHIYRFYFAFDHNDPVYEDKDMRTKISNEFYRLVGEENTKRWHPTGYKAGETVDGSTLLVSIHFVHCPYSGKPAWAHSDATLAAFKEGADYAFRMNDDTASPSARDWCDRFIRDLRDRKPVPNLGVVGPSCPQGAQQILTHDFSHRTHAAIFGFHYPRSLPDWSSDDFISYVYEFLSLMRKRHDLPVIHHMAAQRYANQQRAERLKNLNAELKVGVERVNDWVEQHYGVRLPFNIREIECC